MTILTETPPRGHRLRITISRNADGVVRVTTWENWFEWNDGSEFWWSEGNYACDCNREGLFLGTGPTAETRCGRDRYTVVSITQDEDPTVLYAEDP